MSLRQLSLIAWSQLSALPSDWPSMLRAGLERFIVIKVGTQQEVSLGYIVARSLDQQLGFWNRMWRWLLELGIGGVLIGCVVSYIIARGISRPIHILQSAFRRVSQGDFNQQGDSMIGQLRQFLGGSDLEDDVTLIVVKFESVPVKFPHPA